VSRVETGLRRFEGAAAILTGGSSGIGLSTARRLAGEGCDLCLVAAPEHAADLERALQLLRELGVRAVGIAEDIGEPETSDRAVALALETFGRLDYLVNNAGIGPSEDVFDSTVEQYDRIMRVNVRGMFLAAMAAARAMAAADEGARAMVFTASTASFMGEERQVLYNTSKGAVLQLVRSLGVALAPYDIRVNAVAPGFVRTEKMSGSMGNPGRWSRARARIAADRPAEMEEIASVIAFLLSRDASYMTGATIVVDGAHTAGWRNTDWQAVVLDDMTPRPRRRLEVS
jgi:NAD(P)-dependent dehydrogenase (short-subunit alcohol dehydrogenase family)